MQVLVAVVLARSFSPMVAALVIATFVAYVSWTTLMTGVRFCICYLPMPWPPRPTFLCPCLSSS